MYESASDQIKAQLKGGADMENRLTVGVEEFAKLTGISRPHAYRLVKHGEVPSIRLGKRIFVPNWYVKELLDKPVQGE